MCAYARAVCLADVGGYRECLESWRGAETGQESQVNCQDYINNVVTFPCDRSRLSVFLLCDGKRFANHPILSWTTIVLGGNHRDTGW